MELTLKRLLEQAEFTKKRGAYDVVEVDDFLDRAVAMAAKVETRLNQALEQAKAAETTASGPSHAEVEAEVERRVAVRLAEQPPAPPAPVGPTEDERAEEVRRTLVLAQRTADAAVREAREDAARVLAEAEERAETLRREADDLVATTRAEVAGEAAAERDAARARLAAEIGELEGAREALRADVSVLEVHVEEQRTQLRSTVGELQRLLDDPAGFRLAPAPALLEPELPDLSDVGSPTPAAAEVPEPEPQPVEAPPVEAAAPPAASFAPPVGLPRSGGPAAVVIGDDPAPAPVPDALSFDEVDHAAPGVSDPFESGPPTRPVSAVDLGVEPPEPGAAAEPTAAPGAPRDDDDAFLAELRKAMADGEPLGPRDDSAGGQLGPMFDDDDRRSWRFGKRR